MMSLTLRGLALYPLIFGVAAALAAENDFLDKLRRDAEQGDASAQFNLGLTYDNGIGVPRIMLKLPNGPAAPPSKDTPWRNSTSA